MQTLSKQIKSVDDATKKLESSIGRMDDEQVRSHKTFLDGAAKVRGFTDVVNKYAAARKAANAADAAASRDALSRMNAEAKAFNDYHNKRNQAYLEDIQRSKSAAAAESALESSRNKSFRSQLDNARKLDNALKGSTAKDSLRETEKAASNLTKRFESAGREAERAASKTEKLSGSMRRLKRDVDVSEPATTRLGRAIQGLTEHFDNANNSSNRLYVRILGLRLGVVGLITTLPAAIGALTQLGGLLVAVADAAGLAAAALGGALVASIAQATPVIGLLVIAFKQLFDIVKLTGDQQKLAGQTAHEAADKSLALQRRLEQERQAHIALFNAQNQLINARKDAIRNIQDLNKAEKEAELTSRRSTLSLIGSQAALAGLVAGGGSALDIANAQLDVKDAQGAVSSAKLNQSRSRTDAATARRQGVSGNPQVIAAQQAIAQQQRALILDAKEYAAQQNKVSSAMDLYRQALNKLDPAQRRLFDSVVELRKEFTKNWKGITDPIINAFTGIVKGITGALRDPAIKEAFKGLSGATGSAITTSTSFFGTPEAKKLFLQVMKDARENLPIIANILKDITIIFGRVAVAAGPFVHEILKAILDFFDRVTKYTSNPEQLSGFFEKAFEAAEAFWNVFTGIVDLFMALGEGGAAKTGVELVGQLGRYLHNIADELRGNKAGTGEFFKNLKTTVGDLGTLLDHVFRSMIKISNTGAFDALIKVLDKLILPALTDFLVLAGKIITKLANFSLAHPDLVKTAALIFGIGVATTKLIGFTSTALALIGRLAKAYAIASAAATLSAAEIEIAGATAAAGWTAMLIPIALVIAGIAIIGTAIYLLDKKFHFLAPTFKWVKSRFNEMSENARDNMSEIKDKAEWLADKLEPIFKRIGDHQIDKWIIKKLGGGEGVKGKLGDLLDWLTTHSLIDAFTIAFEGIAGIVTDVVDKVQSLIDKLGILSISVSDLLSKAGLGGADASTRAGAQVAGRYGYVPGSGTGTGTLKGATAGGGPAKGIAGIGGSSGNSVLDEASKSIGVPYVWGGTNPKAGVDCSGLVWAAAKKMGFNIPRRSQEQAKMGVEVPQGQLQAGDLLFYSTIKGKNSHEAIYAGNGKMLVAAHTGTNVEVVDFKTNSLTAMRRVKEWDLAAADTTGKAGGTSSTGVGSQRSGGGQGVASSAKLNAPVTAGKGSAVADIIAAAKRNGIDPQVFLATALTESGGQYGRVGDGGTSFGPFQHHKGGALGNKDAAWANSSAALDERARQFKRLQIQSGKGAAALQRPGDPAGYAKLVDGNMAQAAALIGTTVPGTMPKTPARGPGARGGEALTHIQEVVRDLINLVPNYTQSIGGMIKQAQSAFRDKSPKGKEALVAVFSQFDGIMDRMAREVSKLIGKQRTKLINARYRVSGASGNTSVQDRGSDLQDAIQNVTDLGFVRDGILAEVLAVDEAVRGIKKMLSRTKNKARRTFLTGVLTAYENKQSELQAQLDDNTLAIVAAQESVIQEMIAKVNSDVDRVMSRTSVQIAIANLTGNKSGIPALIDEQMQALVNSKGGLWAVLEQAVRDGNTKIFDEMVKALASVDQQLVELMDQKFNAIEEALLKSSTTGLANNDLYGRLASLGGGTQEQRLQRQRGVLQDRGPLLQQQREGLLSAYGQVTTSEEADKVQKELNENSVQISENTDALRENADQLRQAHIDAIEDDFNRKFSLNDLASRAANLGGNSVGSLGRQTGVLQQRGNILKGRYQAELGIYGQSVTAEEANASQDRLNELQTQIMENTDALRANAEQLKQAHVDAINNLASFKGGINSGVGGLIQSLANQTGNYDLPAYIKSLGNQQNNLKTQGAGLRGDLLSQFGINLSNDPNQLISQLNSTDFGALTFGMDDSTKSTFMDLINSIITNATALVDNTTELNKANGQSNIQDWSSSLWSNFRDALFTGNTGILAGIPQAATGAHIVSGGLMRVHSGETIVPASVSKYSAGDTRIEVNVDNRGEGDVDTLALTKRLAFEMKTR